MRFCFFIFVGLLCQGLTPSAEEVEVIEAIPGSEEMKDHNKTRNEPSLGHLSLESLMDLANPPKKHAYNAGPSRTANPPPRPNNDHYSHTPFGIQKNNKRFDNKNSYNGPPPPPPNQAMDKYDTSEGEIWPAPAPDMPKIISLDVKCEKNLMKVYIGFDKPFYGIVFSKGHYSNVHCVHLPVGLGRTSAHFEIGIHACGTAGNTENGLYGYGAESGSGTYFENVIVIQYDPQVQEVWDQARKLRCTWHDQYEKSVTFRPFPVDMLDVVRTDFAGDNVGCWMQIQVGKGPWASEVSGLVKIGQTMTMVLAIKDDDSKFDMLVRNCMAHDGKRAPIQLVDQQGCLTRPKLMSRFTKIKNFGASASVLSYAHFQAFKFPDSMEVHFQCTIQICRYQCPDQCSDSSEHIINSDFIELSHGPPNSNYGIPPPHHPHLVETYIRPREDRRSRRAVKFDPEKEVGVNRVIRVVSTGDLTFSLDENTNSATPPTMVFPTRAEVNNAGLICMTNSGFATTLVVLLVILMLSCLMSVFLCAKLRPLTQNKLASVTGTNPRKRKSIQTASCFYS
ncbi:transmembrane protein dusky [Leptinotarsa decemlineata]|uniref:transmembrane protein dusky n=1 Tax=Leptinotarsa decemlineata TaxID=7539 RepID=UPI003D30D140